MCSGPRDAAGFTLLEALVAIVIISIGLLGLLQLQTASLSSTQISAAQTQATIATQSMIARLQANPGGVRAGYYDDVSTAGVAENNSCDPACTVKQMARYDATQWKDRLARDLANGQGYVERVSAAGEQPRFAVTVRWTAKNPAIADVPNATGAADDECSNDDARCRRTLVTP